MSYGAFIAFVNNDTKAHSILVTNISGMDNINNLTNPNVLPFTAFPQTNGLYIESSGNTLSSFNVVIDNLPALYFSENDKTYAIDLSTVPSGITVEVDNNTSSNPNGNQAIITIAYNNPSPCTWMHDLNAHNPQFFLKTFSEICLPGSHDAGMSVLSTSSVGSTEDTTQTQTGNIQTQLENGVRYFDMRPAFWGQAAWAASPLLYLGHLTGVLGDEIGSLGQDLVSALTQVATFVNTYPSEIVLLKFSGYLVKDGSSFGDAQLAVLKSNLSALLGSNMYINDDTNVNIGTLSLQSVYATGKRVICTFEVCNNVTIQDTANGYFSRVMVFPQPAQYLKVGNFFLFDNYSNTDLYSTMLWGGPMASNADLIQCQGQITPHWANYQTNLGPVTGGVFLFSNTLTLIGSDNVPLIGESIESNAALVNPYLLGNILHFSYTYSPLPNIMYVDYVDNTTPINAALYANGSVLID